MIQMILKTITYSIAFVWLSLYTALTFAETTAGSQYYGAALCAYEGFHCIAIKKSDTWEQLFPTRRERDMVKRFNRTNMALRTRPWIVVPDDLEHMNYAELSPLPAHLDSATEKVLLVSLSLQAFGAYDAKGNLVYWGPISSGKDFCPDIKQPCRSAAGTFRLVYKRGANCTSDKFPIETGGGAPMPYCMYYYRGFALHGSTLPGYRASHGCIRLFVEDAKWLNTTFLETGSRIIVNGDEPTT